ncbi:L51/S25/CI-B8 domain-containing protein [Ascoidea rubescens DSM 1968]|uniref:NI8M subunit of mitochondrial NADH:ubiquinone oxidoreductase n=1 Tax=Ascoidea rubescens DSM 1968 TaxID=1344418 RepID=A0A1D2VMB7_9ASCO|nr:NI8M subunit of mitochondrial NADH:ubiquinone oxidoreductase [Ascoidea rubescens DSM 1968]ODV62751.1 NI8M subunit of mitochondrial NADH:ubiquinone oxidoreductase [Ascoidea rubescens DSM 1968]
MFSKIVFSNAVKELRFHLSQSGPESVTLKQFLTKNYSAIKSNNPQVPLLVREAHGVSPALYARFDYGRESKFELEGKDLNQINDILKTFAE